MNPFEKAMQEVLRRPRYNRLAGRSIDFNKIISDIVERILGFISNLFNLDFPEMPAYNLAIIAHIFLIVAVLLLTLIIATVAVILYRRRKRRMGYGFLDGDDSLLDANEERLIREKTPIELLDVSGNYASEGKWRLAVRFYYLAVLLELHNNGTVRIEKHKTNTQIIRDIKRTAPALTQPFSVLVEIIHYVWFGYKEAGERQYTLFSDNAALVRGDGWKRAAP